MKGCAVELKIRLDWQMNAWISWACDTVKARRGVVKQIDIICLMNEYGQPIRLILPLSIHLVPEYLWHVTEWPFQLPGVTLVAPVTPPSLSSIHPPLTPLPHSNAPHIRLDSAPVCMPNSPVEIDTPVYVIQSTAARFIS